MTAPALHRATLTLGAAAIATCVFVLTAGLGETVDLIHVRAGGAVVVAVLGALAVIAGVRRLPVLGLISGIGFLAAAVLQLVQLGQAFNLLGGDGSTMALLGGLGIGLVSIWLVGRAVNHRKKNGAS